MSGIGRSAQSARVKGQRIVSGTYRKVTGRHFWSWTGASTYSSAQMGSDMSGASECVLAEGTSVRNDSLMSQVVYTVAVEEEVELVVVAGEWSYQVHEDVDDDQL
eukprot:6405677-Heterocapsa_arctica.AAC.1